MRNRLPRWWIRPARRKWTSLPSWPVLEQECSILMDLLHEDMERMGTPSGPAPVQTPEPPELRLVESLASAMGESPVSIPLVPRVVVEAVAPDPGAGKGTAAEQEAGQPTEVVRAPVAQATPQKSKASSTIRGGS